MILASIVLLILLAPVMFFFLVAFIVPQATVEPIPYATVSLLFALCIGIIWGGLFQ